MTEQAPDPDVLTRRDREHIYVGMSIVLDQLYRGPRRQRTWLDWAAAQWVLYEKKGWWASSIRTLRIADSSRFHPQRKLPPIEQLVADIKQYGSAGKAARRYGATAGAVRNAVRRAKKSDTTKLF